MKTKVYIFDRFHKDALATLQQHTNLEITHETSPIPNLQVEHDHEIIIIRSRTKINKDFLAAFPKVKMIVSATSGFDHFDFKSLKNSDVQAYHCPEANADSAAELTWGLLLDCARNISNAHLRISHALWKDEALNGRQLKGKTLFVIGYGRIGKRVARIAEAFQMKVIAHDPYIDIEEQEPGIDFVELETGLTKADFVSLHVPKTSKTYHLLNSNNLPLLPPHAILINTSRGDVIEEKALIKALRDTKLCAAGLDVFSKEPLKENTVFFEFKNVVLSPHAGAFTEEAFRQGSIECAEKVLSFLAGKTPCDPLPPKAKWVEDLDAML